MVGLAPPAAAAAAPLVAARPSLAETEVSSTTSNRLTFRLRSVPMAAAARAALLSSGWPGGGGGRAGRGETLAWFWKGPMIYIWELHGQILGRREREAERGRCESGFLETGRRGSDFRLLCACRCQILKDVRIMVLKIASARACVLKQQSDFLYHLCLMFYK